MRPAYTDSIVTSPPGEKPAPVATKRSPRYDTSSSWTMHIPLREMIGRGITAPNALIPRSTDTSATDHAAPCGYGPGPIVIDGGGWPAFTGLVETTRPDSSRRRPEATIRNRAPKSCVHRLKMVSRETPVTRNRYMFAAEVAVRGTSLSSSRTPSVAL